MLDAFWADNAATTPTNQLLNAWLVWASRLQEYVVTPAVSPYDTVAAVTGMRNFQSLLARRVYAQRLDVFDSVWVRNDRDVQRTIEAVRTAVREAPEPFAALERLLRR